MRNPRREVFLGLTFMEFSGATGTAVTTGPGVDSLAIGRQEARQIPLLSCALLEFPEQVEFYESRGEKGKTTSETI